MIHRYLILICIVFTHIVLANASTVHINVQLLSHNEFLGADSTNNKGKKLNFVAATDSTGLDSSVILERNESVMVVDTSMGSAPDSGSLTAPKKRKSELDTSIVYSSADSIVYDITKKEALIYKEGKVDYKDLSLKGDLIRFDWNLMTVTATGLEDSSGNVPATPEFSQGDQNYRSSKIAYNFKSKQGKVYEVLTEESGGYLRLEEGKRNAQNEWFGKNAWYTTCNLDHPHYYIRAKKAKVVPNKVVVTGPANLMVGDVPTPLYVPFGIFPLQGGKRSGIILPQYGFHNGFNAYYLKDGGYYIAIKDVVGLSLMGEIYTNGNWGLKTNVQYAKRYKFNGNFSFAYNHIRPSEPDLPGAKGKDNFFITWRHSQSPKARPLLSFTGSINASTSSYNRNTQVTTDQLLNTQLSSNINLVKSWRGMPFQLSLSGNHSQNLVTKDFNLNLPILGFNVSRISPFKNLSDKKGLDFLTNIGFSYNLNAKSYVQTVDSLLFDKYTLDRINYGVKQSLAVNAPFSLFKYFKVNPNFEFTERFYFESVEKRWDPTTLYEVRNDTIIDTIYGKIYTDTIPGFQANSDFKFNVDISTKLTGIFRFKGKKVQAMRHILTPRIGFTYTPDFGSPFWNYYGSVQSDIHGNIEKYSRFQSSSSIYGVPGYGERASLDFNITNTLDLKVFDKKDTVNHERKIPIFDLVSMGGYYNFVADSFNLSPISLRATSSAIPNMNISLGVNFDPYAVNTKNQRINSFQWKAKKQLLRFTDANLAISGRIASKKGSLNNPALVPQPNDPLLQEEQQYILSNPDEYYDFNNPWSFTLSYYLRLSKGLGNNPDTIALSSHSLSVQGDFNLTPNWKVGLSSGFDFVNLEPTLTNVRIIRNLHCWELSFNWTAFPVRYQNYMILLKVNSGILQELKLSKKGSVNYY